MLVNWLEFELYALSRVDRIVLQPILLFTKYFLVVYNYIKSMIVELLIDEATLILVDSN